MKHIKPLLIGQAPGPNTDARAPLFPNGKTSTGARLASVIGVSPRQYIQLFDRTNLLQTFPGRNARDDAWPVVKGRVAAEAVRPFLRGRTVFFVGQRGRGLWLPCGAAALPHLGALPRVAL